GQDRVGSAGPDRRQGTFDLRGSQLQLRADIRGDVQQRLLRRAGTGLDSLAGIDHEVGERALGVLDVRLDAGRQQLGTRHQGVAGLAAAALDAPGYGFDARAEQVLELRDAGVEVGRDRADLAFDAGVDFLEARRDVVGQLAAAAVDGVGDVGDTGINRRDRLCR